MNCVAVRNQLLGEPMPKYPRYVVVLDLIEVPNKNIEDRKVLESVDIIDTESVDEAKRYFRKYAFG